MHAPTTVKCRTKCIDEIYKQLAERLWVLFHVRSGERGAECSGSCGTSAGPVNKWEVWSRVDGWIKVVLGVVGVVKWHGGF